MSHSFWPMDCSPAGSCLSLSSGVCSDLCPLSQWCYLTISFSTTDFFSCLQSFSASESFPMSQLFISGGQSIGASTSASVLSMNFQDWFPLGLTDLISLQSEGVLRPFSITTQFKSISYLALILLFFIQLSHPYMTIGKTTVLTRRTFVSKVMPLLSMFVMAFLPRSKCLLISWL